MNATIDIPFDPSLTLGPFSTTWHSLFTLVGIAIATAIATRRARVEARARYGEGPGDAHVYAVAFVSVAGGLIGSRIFHVIDYWPVYASDLMRILDLSAGQSVVGGLVGGLVVGGAAVYIRKLPFGIAIDCAALGIPFGMAAGRIGDLINGEHWSIACSGLPWCVRYTNPLSAGQRDYVQPAVGYELILDLAIGVALVAMYRGRGRRLGDGRLMFAFAALYGVVRFFDTFLRLDAPLWGRLALAQWTALAFVVAGVVGWTIFGPLLARAFVARTSDATPATTASRATRPSSSRARRS